MSKVGIEPGLAWRALVLTILLSWPLLVFGRPAYFDDSPGYYNGGATAFAFLAEQFGRKADGSGSAGDGDDDDGTKVARSIPYSITTYVLSAPQAKMYLLVLFQAALLAFVTVIFLFAAGARDGPRFWGGAVVLAFATPAAFFASFAMPDILAALGILVMAILAFFLAELSLPVAVLLVLVGGFSISAHASHLGIAAALLPLALLWCVWRQRQIGGRFNLPPLGWIAAPVALGWAVVLLSGYVGFGEVTVAAKRYPLTLARSIEDGPARWYLDRHCAERRYAVCEFFDPMPESTTDFLWGKGGLIARATPQQMDRIRAEEQEILMRAAEAYPQEQATEASKGLLTQLVSFGLAEVNFDHRIFVDPEGSAQWERIDEPHPGVRFFVEKLSQLSVVLALLWLIIGFRSAPIERKALLLFILAGLLANAAICAIFSAVADRYQARVIWLLPLVAIAAWPLRLRRQEKSESA